MAGESTFLTDSTVRALIQQGYLERMFHDALVTETKFRIDTDPQKWQSIWGDSKQMTREGLYEPYLEPLHEADPGSESGLTTEYWMAYIQEYGRKVAASKRKSHIALANLLMKKADLMGKQGGVSIDHLARLRYYEMALWGHAAVTAAVSGASSVHVNSLLGFNKVHTGQTLVDVSASHKLGVNFIHSGSVVTAHITAVTPDDNSKPDGPGTLTLDGNVTLSKDDVAYTDQASFIAFPNGKTGLGAIQSSDVLTLAQIRLAKTYMKLHGVPVFPDGTYHCHLDAYSASQLFADAEFRSYATGQLSAAEIQMGAIKRIFGITFFENEHVPTPLNIPDYGSRGDYLPTPNSPNDVGLYYPILIGADALKENWVDVLNDVNKELAPLVKLPGTQTVTARQTQSGGFMINVDRIAIHFTPPIDTFGDQINIAWEFFGGFNQPTDYNTTGGYRGGQAVYKRCVVIPHA